MFTLTQYLLTNYELLIYINIVNQGNKNAHLSKRVVKWKTTNKVSNFAKTNTVYMT